MKTYDDIKDSVKNGINPSNEEERDFKIVKGVKLAKMKIKKYPWIVESLIPEKAITAITADSGKGKSIFSLILAKYIASGEKLFDEFYTKKSKILIIDNEMDKDIIAGRFQAVIKDTPKGIHYLYEQFLTLDDAKDYKWLKEAIIKNKYKVLIIDTISTSHTKDENSASEMKIINILLLKLIKETGVTIIYLHHHRKSMRGESFSQASARGSTEIIAKVASHLLVSSKKRLSIKDGKFDNNIAVQDITIQQEKMRRPENIVKIGFSTTYDKTTKLTTWEYNGAVDENLTKVEEAKNKIIGLMKKEDREWTKQELIDELKTSETSTRNALDELEKNEVISVITGKGRNWNTKYYSLTSNQSINVQEMF